MFVVGPCDSTFDAAGFYYAKVPVDDVVRVRELTARGFMVVDVNIGLALDPAAVRYVDAPVEVVPAGGGDAEALLEIAETCFRYSRFHLDPELDGASANRVKREWVRSYFEGRRGVELLKAVVDGEPVGFLAVLEDVAAAARIIDLVGVAPSAQRRGVGASLVGSFVRRHGGAAKVLRVGTQIANVPSLRLYSTFGFVVENAAYVLHRHIASA